MMINTHLFIHDKQGFFIMDQAKYSHIRSISEKPFFFAGCLDIYSKGKKEKPKKANK